MFARYSPNAQGLWHMAIPLNRPLPAWERSQTHADTTGSIVTCQKAIGMLQEWVQNDSKTHLTWAPAVLLCMFKEIISFGFLYDEHTQLLSPLTGIGVSIQQASFPKSTKDSADTSIFHHDHTGISILNPT